MENNWRFYTCCDHTLVHLARASWYPPQIAEPIGGMAKGIEPSADLHDRFIRAPGVLQDPSHLPLDSRRMESAESVLADRIHHKDYQKISQHTLHQGRVFPLRRRGSLACDVACMCLESLMPQSHGKQQQEVTLGQSCGKNEQEESQRRRLHSCVAVEQAGRWTAKHKKALLYGWRVCRTSSSYHLMLNH